MNISPPFTPRMGISKRYSMLMKKYQKEQRLKKISNLLENKKNNFK